MEIIDQIYSVNPADIIIEENYNCRKDYGRGDDWQEFKESIRQVGVITPIHVEKTEDGRILLRRGHRRMKAIGELTKAGTVISSVPVTFTKPGDDRISILIESHFHSNNAKPLTHFEEARFFDGLIKNEGMNQKEVALRCGVSMATISQRLKLLKLAETVEDAVISGSITQTDALKIALKLSDTERMKRKAAPVQQPGNPREEDPDPDEEAMDDQAAILDDRISKRNRITRMREVEAQRNEAKGKRYPQPKLKSAVEIRAKLMLAYQQEKDTAGDPFLAGYLTALKDCFDFTGIKESEWFEPETREGDDYDI